MKRSLFFQLLLLFGAIVYAQSDTCSLSLKLIKPDGRVNESAYFEVTFSNNSDLTFVITLPSDASRGPCTNSKSFLIPEVVMKNGEVERGNPQGFFYFVYKGEGWLEIPPGESYVLRLPISIANDGYTGILGLKQVNVSKVRVILDELFMGAMKGMTSKSIRKTLYSNWVDVSNEDFSSVLHP